MNVLNCGVPFDGNFKCSVCKTTEFDKKIIHGFARGIRLVAIRLPANAVLVLCCAGPNVDGYI